MEAEYVIIEEGVANEFKGIMQEVYDFLTDCSTLLNSCSVIEKLGFDDGGIAKGKTNIETTKGNITHLLSQVLQCEEELIGLDERGSKRLYEVFQLSMEEELEEVIAKDDTTTKTSGGGGGGYNPKNNNPPYVKPPTVTVDPITNPITGPYQFSDDPDEAYRLGDIFVDEEMSLTKFTNMLLEKYEISDEGMAKKLYEAVLIYGNEYFYEYGQNPLNVVSEEDVLSSLYDILKDDFSEIPEDEFWDSLKNVKIDTKK